MEIKIKCDGWEHTLLTITQSQGEVVEDNGINKIAHQVPDGLEGVVAYELYLETIQMLLKFKGEILHGRRENQNQLLG